MGTRLRAGTRQPPRSIGRHIGATPCVHARRAAALLSAAGLRAGERVALLAPGGGHLLLSCGAGALSESVLVLLPPQRTARDAVRIMRESGARLLLFHPARRATAEVIHLLSGVTAVDLADLLADSCAVLASGFGHNREVFSQPTNICANLAP